MCTISRLEMESNSKCHRGSKKCNERSTSRAVLLKKKRSFGLARRGDASPRPCNQYFAATSRGWGEAEAVRNTSSAWKMDPSMVRMKCVHAEMYGARFRTKSLANSFKLVMFQPAASSTQFRIDFGHFGCHWVLVGACRSARSPRSFRHAHTRNPRTPKRECHSPPPSMTYQFRP